MTTENIFDALDNCDYVCYMPACPEAFYGPMNAAEAMDFTAKWNNFFAERGIPGSWIAKPLLPKP